MLQLRAVFSRRGCSGIPKTLFSGRSHCGYAFRAACVMKPHPLKAKGEDAAFASSNLLAVADGVGGWAEVGIDSGAYARELLNLFERETATAEKGPETSFSSPRDVVEALDRAWRNIHLKGSTTCCAMYLSKREPIPTLYTLNLGDSGFLVYRPSVASIIGRGRMLQHSFNCPYQLGCDSSDMPQDAATSILEMDINDRVVLATDGVWDNLYDHQIADILREESATPQELAENVVKLAFEQSHDSRWESPFARRERTIVGRCSLGGKPDDITVVIATLKPSDEPSDGETMT